jgi:hypothetical protein
MHPGDKACHSLLQVSIKTPTLGHVDKVLVLDLTPVWSNEWAASVMLMQAQKQSGEQIPYVVYAALCDAKTHLELEADTRARLLKSWWPTQISDVDLDRPQHERPQLEVFSWIDDVPTIPDATRNKFGVEDVFYSSWKKARRARGCGTNVA